MFTAKCKTCGKKWSGTSESDVDENIKVYPCTCSENDKDIVKKKMG